MERKVVDLGAINGKVIVNVCRKNIKNVHLKVYRTMEVSLSVPNRVPKEWIDSFLSGRKAWINEQITMFKKSSGYNNITSIRSGSSVRLLGKDMRVYKEHSLKNHVQIEEKRITLYLKDIQDEELVRKIFAKWWRKRAAFTYQQIADEFFERVFNKYDIAKPGISIRKMKTLWGSCTPSKCKITLNEYLLKAEIRCIQYVVLHEMAHLLYPNHNSDFYNFLTVQMPDWPKRKECLDTEVVQGL